MKANRTSLPSGEPCGYQAVQHCALCRQAGRHTGRHTDLQQAGKIEGEEGVVSPLILLSRTTDFLNILLPSLLTSPLVLPRGSSLQENIGKH
jgi:hypothetical protein